MRYGVVSDIHGNLPALQATVRHLRDAGADSWLCAGDVVGYGPQPNECVEMLVGLGAVCVAGNHELALLHRLPEDCVGALAAATLRWSRTVLGRDALEFLAALPQVVEVDGLVLTHGSLADPTEYVSSRRTASLQLQRLAESWPAARVLVVGHTHRSRAHGEHRGALRARRELVLDQHQRFLLNPGSVGQSRQWERRPRTRSMLLDTGRGQATFFALDYDVDATLALLRSLGFPRTCVQHARHPVGAGVRRVRGLAARLQRSARAAGVRSGVQRRP